MSRTINTRINSTLSLQPTDNPLTITASGGVIVARADAIDGDSSTAWAISNAGTVSSTSGYGVSLADRGLRDQLFWRVDLGDRSDEF